MVLWPLQQAGPLLLLAVIGRVEPVVLLALVVVSAGLGAVRWSRFTWGVEGDALVIAQGLVRRERRVIPLERVQGVELVRSVRHRVLGLVEVRVEAVGGSQAEGRLDALAPEEADQLRGVLLRRGRAPAAADAQLAGAPEDGGPAERVLAELAPRDLVVAGLTGGRVGVAAALVGLANQLFADRVEQLATRLPALVGGTSGLLLLGLVLLVVVFVLSVALTTVTNWGFRLSRAGGELRIRRGLLEQRSETTPLRRVQAARVEENALRRPFGLAALRVDVAGRAGEERTGTGVVLPIGQRRLADGLVGEVLARPGAAAVALTPMPPGARSRRLVRGTVPWVLLGAGLGAVLGPAWLAVAGLAVPGAALGLAGYRALGWAVDGDVVVARAGVLVRRTAFVPVGRLQSLSLTSSPLQRRRGLATLELHIARSTGAGGDPALVDLDAAVGRQLLTALAHGLAHPDAVAPRR